MTIIEAIEAIQNCVESSIKYSENLVLVDDGQCSSLFFRDEWENGIEKLSDEDFTDPLHAYSELTAYVGNIACSSDCFRISGLDLPDFMEVELKDMCPDWKEKFSVGY